MFDKFRNQLIPGHKQETLLEYTDYAFIEAGEDNRNLNHYTTKHTNLRH